MASTLELDRGPRFMAVVCTVFAVGCATSTSTATTAPALANNSGAFVVTLGTDTVAVEQYTRVGNRIEGDVLQRSPRTSLSHYVLTLNESGQPARLEVTSRLPNGAPVTTGTRSVTVNYGRDTIVSQIQRDTMATVRVAGRDIYPFVPNVWSLLEVPIARGRAMTSDSIALTTYGLGAARTNEYPLVRRSPNTYWFYIGGFPQVVTVDNEGRITSVSGRMTTLKTEARRVPSVNITALAQSFAARDQAGQAMGPPSPRDTVRAAIGAAQLWIDYGRPATRGRSVFGANGVLGDTIWRTGANAATQFRTDRDLEINGQTVPAGTYTLWTHAVPGRYELIFNRQIGQWGTEYHPERDLVRVPLTASQLASRMERFTIAVDPSGNGGLLKLMWDTTQLSVPFTVK